MKITTPAHDWYIWLMHLQNRFKTTSTATQIYGLRRISSQTVIKRLCQADLQSSWLQHNLLMAHYLAEWLWWKGGRKEENILFNDALNTFYLQLYGLRHMVKNHSDSERGNLLPPHRLLFQLTASILLYEPSHRQDSTYHGLCYTSHGALAGTRNSSMGPWWCQKRIWWGRVQGRTVLIFDQSCFMLFRADGHSRIYQRHNECYATAVFWNIIMHDGHTALVWELMDWSMPKSTGML